MEAIEEITSKFQCFNKQFDAFELQKRCLGKRCLSVEFPPLNGGNALRRFIVVDLLDFWLWYRNEYSGPKHFYELIQEGYPCRLYFDLEYQIAENPNIKPDENLDSFINFVNKMVEEHYNLKITRKNWLILDSTTKTKFSAHATVHLPRNYVFSTNIAMRTFIDALIHRMSETGIGMIKKGEEETYFCDTAVYTKNRCFRLFLSCKGGKSVVLKLKNDCTFYDKIPKDDYKIFLDSLVIPQDYQTCPKLKVPENPSLVLKQTRITGSVRSMSIPQFSAKMPIIQPNPAINLEVIAISSGISPLSELDDFVVEFNKKFVPDVTIRTWTYLIVKPMESKRIQYQFINCRYCLRMGREHKSNNVYWTVHLEGMYMFQRCFDCRDFVSNYFYLPNELIEKITPKIEAAFKRRPEELQISDDQREKLSKSLEESGWSIDPTEKLKIDADDDEIEIIDEKRAIDSFDGSYFEKQVINMAKKENKQPSKQNSKTAKKLIKTNSGKIQQTIVFEKSKKPLEKIFIDLVDDDDEPMPKKKFIIDE